MEKKNGMVVKRKIDLEWIPSDYNPGWAFYILSGEDDGPLTMRCWGLNPMTYEPWISDGLTEWFVLKGKVTINGQDLSEGDYASADAGVDCSVIVKEPMEMIYVSHGRVARKNRVFKSLIDKSLNPSKAKLLSSTPWIDHLRKHATEKELIDICESIKLEDHENLIELSIGIARKFSDPKFTELVKTILDGNPGLSLRIASLLYLASKDEVDAATWQKQLKIISANRNDLIQIVRHWFGADSATELISSIDKRITDPSSSKSKPFYEMVKSII